jgi:hypothetical protein
MNTTENKEIEAEAEAVKAWSVWEVTGEMQVLYGWTLLTISLVFAAIIG